MTTRTSQNITFLSLVCALLVILQHISYSIPHAGVVNIIYHEFVGSGFVHIAVPFFFLCSGFFFMKRYSGVFSWAWYASSLRKRIMTLVVPYLLWCVLGVVFCRIVYGGCAFRPLEDFGVVTLAPWYGNLWYVKFLLIMCVMSPMVIWAVKFIGARKRLLGVVIIGVLLASFAPIPMKKSMFCAVVYFSLGVSCYLYSDYYVCVWKCHRKSIGITAAVLFVLMASAKAGYAICEGCELASLSMAVSFAGLVAFVAGSGALLENRKVGLVVASAEVQSLARLAFFIYCFHGILQSLVGRIVPFSSISGALSAWLVVCAGSIAVGMATRKFLPPVYALLTGGRGV